MLYNIYNGVKQLSGIWYVIKVSYNIVYTLCSYITLLVVCNICVIINKYHQHPTQITLNEIHFHCNCMKEWLFHSTQWGICRSTPFPGQDRASWFCAELIRQSFTLCMLAGLLAWGPIKLCKIHVWRQEVIVGWGQHWASSLGNHSEI